MLRDFEEVEPAEPHSWGFPRSGLGPPLTAGSPMRRKDLRPLQGASRGLALAPSLAWTESLDGSSGPFEAMLGLKPNTEKPPEGGSQCLLRPEPAVNGGP